MKVIYLRWIDSCSPRELGWNRREELNLNVLHCDTVGMVVSEDKEQISVCSSCMENGLLNGVITIPKVAIVKRRWIK